MLVVSPMFFLCHKVCAKTAPERTLLCLLVKYTFCHIIATEKTESAALGEEPFLGSQQPEHTVLIVEKLC